MARKKAPPLNGLSEEAQRESERFFEAYKALLKEAQKVPLTVLVWGPNPNSESAVARKRNDIRDALRRLGHHAIFSEELPQLAEDISEKSKEYAQARAADLIIILVEGAPGASAEAHDFCNDPQIAPNVFVMIPSKYRDGYSAKGAIRDLEEGYGGVYWYQEGEIEECTVLSRAVKRVEARRHILNRAKGQPR